MAGNHRLDQLPVAMTLQRAMARSNGSGQWLGAIVQVNGQDSGLSVQKITSLLSWTSQIINFPCAHLCPQPKLYLRPQLWLWLWLYLRPCLYLRSQLWLRPWLQPKPCLCPDYFLMPITSGARFSLDMRGGAIARRGKRLSMIEWRSFLRSELY